MQVHGIIMYVYCNKQIINVIRWIIFMKDKEKHLGLRLDEDTHKKLKSLAEFEGRSINGEVIYLIRQAIMRFEKENGKLE